jgi:hypothetical protein
MRLRDGMTGDIGLVEVAGWEELLAGLSREQQQLLIAEIGDRLSEASGPNATAGALAEGRFAVIADEALDPADCRNPCWPCCVQTVSAPRGRAECRWR